MNRSTFLKFLALVPFAPKLANAAVAAKPEVEALTADMVYIPPGKYRITNDLTFPHDVFMARGAHITVPEGVTLRFSGNLYPADMSNRFGKPVFRGGSDPCTFWTP